MTSLLPLRVVIELGRPSLRLLLLCRSNFLDVIDIKRDRRGNTAKPDGDHAVLAYVRDDGTFCGRMEPSGRWLRPAFTRIKRRGWVEASFGFGKGAVIFFLSDRGKPEALAAKERVKAVREARRQWGVDWNEAWRAKQGAA